ncbi:hypothetical protein NKG94_26470 [Micromonospora sp. M12]
MATLSVLSCAAFRPYAVGDRCPAAVARRVDRPGRRLALAGWLLLPGDDLRFPVRLVAVLTLGGLAMAALDAFAGHGDTPARWSAGRRPAHPGRAGAAGHAAVRAGRASGPAGRTPLVFGMLLVAVGAADAAGDTEPAEPVVAAWPRSVLPGAVLLLASGLHLAPAVRRTGRACCWSWRRCRPGAA